MVFMDVISPANYFVFVFIEFRRVDFGQFNYFAWKPGF